MNLAYLGWDEKCMFETVYRNETEENSEGTKRFLTLVYSTLTVAPVAGLSFGMLNMPASPGSVRVPGELKAALARSGSFPSFSLF